MKNSYFIFLLLFLLLTSIGFSIFFLIKFKISKTNAAPIIEVTIPESDTEENLETLRVILRYSASDYFIYKGIPIGFQYELLRELEKELKLNIEIITENSIKNISHELFKENFDIAILDLPQCEFLLPLFNRSVPHSYSHPVLVTGNNEDTSSNKQIIVSSDFFAKLFFDIQSKFQDFSIQICNCFTTEELFEQVDNNEIQYLVCDYNQAITLLPFYSNVQILEKAGPLFERRWILNPKNIQLNEDINHWLLDFKKTNKYRWLLRKYFAQESPLINASFAKNSYNNISQYDDIIKKYAEQYDFDWRFVASIICQESKFIPRLTGNGGSYGLMQMMPVTMEYYGISELVDEVAHIHAGVKHLSSIRKSFEDIDNKEEQLYFVAAAYNAGRGHIFDAQRLCAKAGKDFKIWQNISPFLKLKSHRDIVLDEVVKSGYYPGSHTVKYVQQVMNRYQAYKAAYP